MSRCLSDFTSLAPKKNAKNNSLRLHFVVPSAVFGTAWREEAKIDKMDFVSGMKILVFRLTS